MVAVAIRAQVGLQIPQEIIYSVFFLLAPEKLRSLGQARADAIAQFCRGSVCECHDQNLRRHQALPLPTMPQDQPHIQSCQGPCFTCSGTGLNELDALQWQGQHIEPLSGQGLHAVPPSMVAARIRSAYKTGAQVGKPKRSGSKLSNERCTYKERAKSVSSAKLS